MTAKDKQATPASSTPAPVVLFGIDGRGKCKGARFGKEHASLALKAASQLNLKVLASDNPKVAEIAARLPVGRVHGNGRTFVPFIRQDLYDKLLAVAPNGSAQSASSPPSGSSGAPGPTSGGLPPNLPRNWQEIGIGDLVVAHQSPDDGWYEAIVMEAAGDMLTLRWRDYPKEKRIVRHRLRLGLLYPALKSTVGTGKPSKSSGPAKHGKPSPTNPVIDGRALPRDWDDINTGHLVLAKDDGPWRVWWEAIPTEKNGDLLKLRWRDQVGGIATVTRPRLELALICPDPA
jgi:hypothetical protein